MTEEEREASGEIVNLSPAKLKIFFGMSAGVGKTYAMLKEAGILVGRGEDLVIGWVEAHGRAETDALLEGLERVPPKLSEYRGIKVAEMDLDALLARRPKLAIVDELAHSNIPGSRHAKRYEDILELLDAGISVYTTVNIQHLESMADSVELFTLVPIRERVPDSVFDRADDIQMVDIPPEELITRLEEGKVYTGAASRDAVDNFFTRGNLAILREIALRQASQLASHQLLDIMRKGEARSSAIASQRVFVAISPSPNSEALIHWGRRLAYSIKAEWDCAYIETGEELSEAEKARLAENLKLARSLGARVVTTPNADVVAGLIDYAEKNAISILVVGKSGMTRSFWPLGKRSLTERLIADSGTIPVFAVQEKTLKGFTRKRIAKKLRSSPGWQYLVALLAIATTTGINLLCVDFIGYWAVSILYLAVISLLALTLNRRPVLLAALLSALLWNYLFIPPRYTFMIHKLEDLFMLCLYFLVALTSGWMTTRLRANERMLVVREANMALLSDLASELAGTASLATIVDKALSFLKRAFDAEAIVSLRDDSGELKERPEGCATGLDEKSLSAARYCFSSGRSAGRHTSTLPIVEWHFVPMQTPNGCIGVIGLKTERDKAWTEDRENFLQTMSRTISLAVERELLSERNVANALASESERLGKLLLDSVSHELRTPLTVIQGASSALSDEDTARDPVSRSALLGEIGEAVGRLDGIVGNLLSMNRLESGRIKLHYIEADIEDLVSTALKAVSNDMASHEVRLAGLGEAPPIACDVGLVVQVIANLLRNSARYAGKGATIEVSARQDDARIILSIQDNGPGVREADLPRVFEKFFRANSAASGGTGLGLAICKGIVEAHSGRIEARNRVGGGFVVDVALPVKKEGES